MPRDGDVKPKEKLLVAVPVLLTSDSGARDDLGKSQSHFFGLFLDASLERVGMRDMLKGNSQIHK